MAVRDVVEIHEELCDGCGDCVGACAEGAIEVVDGKARLVSDVYCDGLGACLGHCPQGAITVVRRDAPEFDEGAVSRHLAARDRGEHREPGRVRPVMPMVAGTAAGRACPGSRPVVLTQAASRPAASRAQASPALRHWPVQLHLVPPTADFFRDADVLLAADCVAFAAPDFHERLLEGRSLAVACPKLDTQQERYLEKLVAMMDHAGIRSLRVAVMEVPCCGGLVRLAEEALRRARRPVPLTTVVVGTDGVARREAAVAG